MNRKEAVEIIKNSNIYGARMNGKNLIIEAINELAKDITLADFLGWEENVEYEYNGAIYRLKDNQVEVKVFEEFQFPHGVKINFITNLQHATKVEKKPKAYHVKDEYSYNCLMKELKERGHEVVIGRKYDEKYQYICIKDNKVYRFGDCYTPKENYHIIEYHKEEPKFYAKIKGWELLKTGDRYWNYDTEYDCFLPSNKGYCGGYITMATKTEWNELGINDSNADLEEVQE